MSNSLWPHGLQHACPSPSPGACSNSCPLSWWCHPTISSSVVPFSSTWPRSFPASGSFPMSQLFASDGQSVGASALVSVLPINIQYWFPLWLTGLIAVQGTLKSLIQHHSSKASVFWHSTIFIVQLSHSWALPGYSDGKESACNARPGFDPWVRKIPWRRQGLPTPLFLPREFLGQRSLVGYTSRGSKGSDTTEQLSPSPSPHPYMTTGKTIALTIWTFAGKVISLLFNTVSRFVIAFLPKSKHLSISWLQSL